MNELLITIITSSIVSSSIALLAKSFIETRIKNFFDSKLEETKFKNQLKIEQLKVESDIQKQDTEIIIQIFPYTIELIYKLRNIVKEIKQVENFESTKNDFIRLVNEFKTHIYQNRYFFEKHHCFLEIHKYKNLCVSYGNALHNSNSDVQHVFFYNEIEEVYNKIISLLSKR